MDGSIRFQSRVREIRVRIRRPYCTFHLFVNTRVNGCRGCREPCVASLSQLRPVKILPGCAPSGRLRGIFPAVCPDGILPIIRYHMTLFNGAFFGGSSHSHPTSEGPPLGWSVVGCYHAWGTSLSDLSWPSEPFDKSE